MLGEFTHNVFLQKVLLLVLITLLPLIPSYILFKFLPSKSIVTGPFRGFQVDFSGATALYFVIFTTLVTTTQPWDLKNINYEVWTVEGVLNAKGMQDYSMPPRFSVTLAMPPTYEVLPDGTFSLEVLRKMGANGKMEFPMLSITDTDGDYGSRTINLETGNSPQDTTYGIKKNDSNNKLSITKPIKLNLIEDDSTNKNN